MDNLDRYEAVLQKMDNVKLMDVVQNYSHYGYSQNVRQLAKSILAERDVSADDHERLSLHQSLQSHKRIPHAFRIAELRESLNKNINFATIFMTLKIFSLLLLGFSSLFGFAAVGFAVSYYICLFKSMNRMGEIDEILGNDSQENSVLSLVTVFTVLGFYLYVIYQNSKLKEELQKKGI